jgi:hypothetical protein
MESKEQYLRRLQEGVEQRHGCTARHVESVRVMETFRADISWQGTVEVFELTGHAEATRAYCWSHLKGMHDMRTDFVSLLGTPAINCPLAAVRAWIVGDSQKTGW